MFFKVTSQPFIKYKGFYFQIQIKLNSNVFVFCQSLTYVPRFIYKMERRVKDNTIENKRNCINEI